MTDSRRDNSINYTNIDNTEKIHPHTLNFPSQVKNDLTCLSLMIIFFFRLNVVSIIQRFIFVKFNETLLN